MTMTWLIWSWAIAMLCICEGASILSSLDNIITEDSDSGELWAVLVAGSSGWFNYRHQADVCHAYQILHDHGVPDDHIIVMMYDDISNNSLNPNPGVIINRPDGPNVYEGVPRDYTGSDVTPENFLRILKGNAKAMEGIGSGKVVNSTKKDKIFINLVDHGGPGVFCFPEHYLHAKLLARVIWNLHKRRKFKEMVIYVEACESGSLFEGLLPSSKVYAVTAANPHEPSYACYMDDELGTFLGDVFSVKWMEDTDRENIHKETLKKQFHIVRKVVKTSHVMQWGEQDISHEKLSEFLGRGNARISNSIRFPYTENLIPPDVQKPDALHHKQKSELSRKPREAKEEAILSGHSDTAEAEVNYTHTNDPEDDCLDSATASQDVPVQILKSRISTSKTDAEKDEWKRELDSLMMTRMLVYVVMRTLLKEIIGDEVKSLIMMQDQSRKITEWSCHELSIYIFHTKCFNLGQNPYAVSLLHVITNLCESGFTSENFEKAAKIVCTFQNFTGIH